ncbi:MAG TPA: SDR family oxidoreductase [Candidatus Cryosericum sp.]|nr:SDR family oxidoreductase [Candidatus Cryosericum sp.]
MQGRVRTALVTGASSGIGLELCRLLARDGARVVMVARDEERLQRAARWIQAEHPGIGLTLLAADLSAPGAAATLMARVEREVDPIDFLVNNAGVGASGPFAASERAQVLGLIQLNVVSLVELTHLLLPGLLERRRGIILNVASTAAFLPGPWMAIYYASKAFVLSFSEALAEEVGESGVSVTALCPGPTATGFQKRAGIEQSRLLRGPLALEAGPVAAAAYRGALGGRRVVIPGAANKAMVQALRALPRTFVSQMARRANQPGAPGAQAPGVRGGDA